MPQITLTCEECGTEYKRWPSQVEGSRFCTQNCLQVWRKREVLSKHKAPWLTKLNQTPGRNQRIAAASAYKRSKKARTAPGESRAGNRTRYKRKKGADIHRTVASKIAGRVLKYSELVHHIDEDSFNNDPANLVIGITRGEHAWIHTQLKKEGRPKQVNLNLLTRNKSKQKKKVMNYRFKTRPFRHQVRAFKKMVMNGGGALFMEMGTGKTKVAIDWAAAMYYKKGVKHVVVVCPKSVKTVWPLEIKKHLPERLEGKIKFTIINYDRLPDREVTRKGKSVLYEGMRHKLIEEGYDALIVDESHYIKKPSAKRTKALMAMSKHCEYKLILTGTPVAKNPLDLFSQYKFLDEKLLGTNFAQFKRKYAVYGGYGGYQLMRYINLDQLADAVKHKTFEIRKTECLDLPSRTHEIVPVYLKQQSRRVYETLAKDAIVEFEGEEMEADNILTKLLRLSQITGGHFKTKDGYKRIGHEKANKVYDLLTDMSDQDVRKVVIFCRFLPEMADAVSVAKKAGYRPILFYGKVKEDKREQRLSDFDETGDKVCFIAQIATGSVGISLTAATCAIYWSHTYDHGQMAQSYDRLHRIGQHYPVTYYHLICRSTVDEAVWMALKTKKNIADLVLRNPKLLMYEGTQLK